MMMTDVMLMISPMLHRCCGDADVMMMAGVMLKLKADVMMMMLAVVMLLTFSMSVSQHLKIYSDICQGYARDELEAPPWQCYAEYAATTSSSSSSASPRKCDDGDEAPRDNYSTWPTSQCQELRHLAARRWGRQADYDDDDDHEDIDDEAD
jgi:hypothetical protein